MNVICLDLQQNKEAIPLIEICKSNSGKTGIALRNAHYKLGDMLANQISDNFQSKKVTVIIMMRAGLPFGMGIADTLEQNGIKATILFYANELQWKKEKQNCLQSLKNTILLVDSVINSGDSILKFSQQFIDCQDIYFFTNVVSDKALSKFENKNLCAVRISHNSFVGAKTDMIKGNKGPDTGDRLFNTK
ncbi:MAG: phosphoribosyltransferase [Prevotellaceae bacterium]|jgi:uracil phosphoribosyltransferase|nr:phosphoribosyltransferase [Prevotellaceae bacterium]